MIPDVSDGVHITLKGRHDKPGQPWPRCGPPDHGCRSDTRRRPRLGAALEKIDRRPPQDVFLITRDVVELYSR